MLLWYMETIASNDRKDNAEMVNKTKWKNSQLLAIYIIKSTIPNVRVLSLAWWQWAFRFIFLHITQFFAVRHKR